MEITEEHIGKKVFNSTTNEKDWLLVTAVYPTYFSGKDDCGAVYEDYFVRRIPDPSVTWLLVQEPKKKPSEILFENLGGDFCIGPFARAIGKTLDSLFEGK